MNGPTNARPLAVVLAVVLLPLAALTVFTPSYQTNDDIAMRLLAEGNFVPGDQPLPYLMFINIVLGKILALAYNWKATIPWYDLLLGSSMIGATAALVHLWIEPAQRLAIPWALIFSVYFLFPTFVSVQFSLAGLACAASGVGLIVHCVATNLEPRTRRLHLLLGTTLFFWGSLIRFEGAVLIAIEGSLLALPIVFGAWPRVESRTRLRGAVLAACAALLLTGLGFALNQMAYRYAKGWTTFYEYNLLRSRLGEYSTPDLMTAETSVNLAKEVGWSANDFALFRNWFFTDPNLFSLTKVRQAERLFYGAANKPTEGWWTIRLRRGRELAASFFKETRWALAIMGAYVLAHGLRPKLVLYAAGVATTLATIIVGISLTLKAPPQRIFWPMLIMAATMLTIAAQIWGRPSHWSIRSAAVLLGIYIAAIALPPLKRESEARQRAADIAQSDVANLRRTGATMFILHANAFPYEDFWTPLQNEKAKFEFVGLGASARTPPVQDFLARTGRMDLPWSMCNDPSMLIIATADVPPMLTEFVAEHRGVNVLFEEAFRGERILAWKCHRI